MNNIEIINKEVSSGIKKAQLEISSFIEQAIKAKQNLSLELASPISEPESMQGDALSEIN
jgi:hypothetical protein